MPALAGLFLFKLFGLPYLMETNLTSNCVWEPIKYIIKLKDDSLNVRGKKQTYRNKMNPVVIFQECVPENFHNC